MSTYHINAKIGDFANIVLMPGDPLRAKYIANEFLTNSNEVNNIRGMLAYTGKYKGQSISVMGHGMGIPSCLIYVKELISDFGVKRIIRVGSCGAIRKDIKLRDIIIGLGASTDSKVNRISFKDNDLAAIADFNLVRNAVDAARIIGIPIHVGNIFSTDRFYNSDQDILNILEKYGILGVEMEGAGIYSIAAEYSVRALVMCTVSDHIRTGQSLSAFERQHTFNDMIKIALETVLIDNDLLNQSLLCC